MDVTKILAELKAEREQIVRALRESNWVVGGARGAATRLGLKRTSLAYGMQKVGDLAIIPVKCAKLCWRGRNQNGYKAEHSDGCNMVCRIEPVKMRQPGDE